MDSFGAAYVKAVETSKAVRKTRDALLETPDEFIAKVNIARLKLKEHILESAVDHILESAEKGHLTANMYAFNGNDFLDDVSVLFLLKGQRVSPMSTPLPPGLPGPLLPELQVLMAPFDIVHDWDGITGGNRILARWSAGV
jgi:hypothetical protein